MARTRDRRVAAPTLLGPVSDVAGERKRIGRRELARRVAAAKLIAPRYPVVLVPRAWGFRSAGRFVSLDRPGEAEDAFPTIDRTRAGPRSDASACRWR